MTQVLAASDAGRLTLSRVSAEIRLDCAPVRALQVQRLVTARARDDLPRRLAVALDPGPGPEVVRIERIALTIDLDISELMSGQIGAAWAAGIAAAIRARLAGADARVVRFADPPSYGAAYLRHRAGGRTVPGWAFEDLAALDLLAPGEAAAELISGVPSVLTALVHTDGTGPTMLERLLKPAAARLLLARLAAGRDGTPDWPPDAVAAVAAEAATGPARDAALAALLILARLLSPRHPMAPSGVAARARLARLAAMLAPVVRENGSAVPVALEQADPLAPDGTLARLAAQTPGTDAALARDAFAADASAPVPHAMVARLLGAMTAAFRGTRDIRGTARTARAVVDPQAPDPTAASRLKPHGERTRARATEPMVLHSQFAGTALALPILRDLGLWRGLSAQAFRDVLTALAPAEFRPLAAADPALDALSPPVGPGDDAPPPQLRASVLAGLPVPLRAVVAAADGPDAWACVVAFRFAERLPGLAGSSADYVARQFMARPGRVRIEPAGIVVLLAPVPLGVVLRMGGLTGDRGPLPWLGDRRLHLTVEGG